MQRLDKAENLKYCEEIGSGRKIKVEGKDWIRQKT